MQQVMHKHMRSSHSLSLWRTSIGITSPPLTLEHLKAACRTQRMSWVRCIAGHEGEGAEVVGRCAPRHSLAPPVSATWEAALTDTFREPGPSSPHLCVRVPGSENVFKLHIGIFDAILHDLERGQRVRMNEAVERVATKVRRAPVSPTPLHECNSGNPISSMLFERYSCNVFQLQICSSLKPSAPDSDLYAG